LFYPSHVYEVNNSVQHYCLVAMKTLEYCLLLRRKTRPVIDVNIIVNCVLEHEINSFP